MRALLIVLAVAALALGASYGLEANAMMGMGAQGLKDSARSLSPMTEASCADHGMFCPKGSQLQCDPVCICVACGKAHKHAKH